MNPRDGNKISPIDAATKERWSPMGVAEHKLGRKLDRRDRGEKGKISRGLKLIWWRNRGE